MNRFVVASHHRYLWIHPYFDEKGRVARMMSYVALLEIEIGSNLWSVARDQKQYKLLLEAADGERRGDLDDRGTLPQKALIEFCKFFLNV